MQYSKIVVALIAAGVTSGAYATNGMNLEGYGPIALGMGGASMAYDNGTAAVMNNPATLGLMSEGNRVDVAIGMLGPDVSTSAGPMDADSGGDSYFMPAAGWVRKSGPMAYGVAVFAQGGMGTEYSGSSFLSAGSGQSTRSELGVGRMIFPLTYDVNPDLVLGGSLDLVWAGLDLKMAMGGAQFMDMTPMGSQTLGTVGGNMMGVFNDYVMGSNTTGRNPYNMVMMNPANPVNWGFFDFSDRNDYTGQAKATGWAGKLGFTYKINSQLTVGGTYHSKTALGDLKGDAKVSFNANIDDGIAMGGMPTGTYGTAATIPVQGKISVKDFQWPETIGLGMAFQVNDRVMLAADYKRIGWKDVMENFKMTFTASADQPNPMAQGFAGSKLDAKLYQDWDDQDVLSLGVSYKATDKLTLRAGVNVSDNPIPNKYMNPLFPAIVEDHYTLGFGYAFSKAADLNFALSHAPEVEAKNPNMGIKTTHSQTSWQLMYSHRF